MNFTVSTVAKSLAAYLATYFPGVTFYENPNQQGTQAPCFFLQVRYSNIKLQQGGRWLRTLGLDLTYLQDYNLPNLQQLYEAAAEQLDLVMETFPYADGVSTDGSALLRTYDREWRIDLDALHYQFELRAFVSLPAEPAEKMETMTLTQEVPDGI